jgi:uncharacterized protein (DUF1697 family)
VALVVFLRGVNVGGHKTFKPSVLVKELSDYDAVNIGAAGTFVVRKPISQSKLRAEILKRLPFEPDIMICSAKEIIDIASRDPFAGEPATPDIVRFVSVMHKPLKSPPKLPMILNPGDDWLVKIVQIKDRFVFGMYRRAMKTISYLGQVEKRLGVSATTRNWNTINAIVKVLKSNAR